MPKSIDFYSKNEAFKMIRLCFYGVNRRIKKGQKRIRGSYSSELIASSWGGSIRTAHPVCTQWRNRLKFGARRQGLDRPATLGAAPPDPCHSVLGAKDLMAGVRGRSPRIARGVRGGAAPPRSGPEYASPRQGKCTLPGMHCSRRSEAS